MALKGLTSKLDISVHKRNCRTCQNVGDDCVRGTMSTWKSRTITGGRRTKCSDCAVRHRLEREAQAASDKLEARA